MQKLQRGLGQTACEVLSPVVLVALFAWLYLAVDRSVVPAATYECGAAVLDNAKYDFAYLPRVLNATATRLALVGDGALRGAFRAHLADRYPGVSAAAVSALGCSLFQLDSEVNGNVSSAFVPPFAPLLLDFAGEADLEAYIALGGYGEDPALPAVYAAVVFEGCGAGCSGPGAAGGGGAAPQWRYTLRVNASSIPDTHASSDPLQRGASLANLQRYVAGNTSLWASGPPHPLDNRMPGFLELQLAVDRFILNRTTPAGAGAVADALGDVTAFLATWNCSGALSNGSDAALAEVLGFQRAHELLPQRVRLAAFPTPAFSSDAFYSFVQSVFALIFVMTFFFPSFFLIRGLVVEKETRIREGVRMMGMGDLALYASWVATYALLFLVVALCVAVTCAATMFPRSDGGLLFAYFWLFGLSATSLCLALSTLFSRSKLASVVGAVLFIATFFPYFQVNDPLKSTLVKTAASLCAPVAFGLGLDIIATLESNDVGLTLATIGTQYGNFSFALCLGMLALDCVLYLALFWYLNLVVPQEFGLPLPWYFPVTREFWWPHRAADDAHAAAASGGGGGGGSGGLKTRLLDDDGEGGGAAWAPAGGEGVEAPGALLCDLGRAGRCVSVRGLRKEFATPDGVKAAVDGVDLDIFEGQIFVLLGHNGAGKTTLLSVLTGLTPPTSGSCTSYGLSITRDMQALRQSMGVCPQHDVLWPDLTVEEHLLFFAGLKGLAGAEAQAAVRTVVRDVGLTEKIRTLSCDLSGGMKRKLSVAIALVGDSKVVFLDEPTSGMDPYSRRSTWQILQNARQGRALVLTTHFMDEADLLGDRIAIMADGRIRCCGSSMYLKKLHGVGYLLACVKRTAPAGPGLPACDSAALEAAVRGFVPEAAVLSDVGAELSFQVPLTASPQFPALFAALEARAAALGVLSYGISVTTLEEVFMRVAEGRDHHGAAKAAAMAVGKEAPLAEALAVKPAGPELAEAAAEPAPQRERAFFARHFYALLLKRWRFALRDQRAVFFQLFIPIAALSAGLALLHQIGTATWPAIDVSLRYYNAGVRNPDAAAAALGASPNFVPFDASQPFAATVMAAAAAAGAQAGGNFEGLGAAAGASFLPVSNLGELFPAADYVVSNVSNAGCLALSYADGLPTAALALAESGNGSLSVLSDAFAMSSWLLAHRNGSSDADAAGGAEAGASRFVAVTLSRLASEGAAADAGAFASYTAFVNTTAFHAGPAAVNLVNNGLFNWVSGGAGASIRTTNAPLPFTQRQYTVVSSLTSFVSVLFVVIAFSFVPASFAAFVVKEREVGAKHQQLVSGVSIVAYWGATFAFDLANYALPGCAALALVAAFDVKELLGDSLPATALLVALYGSSVAGFTYCTSFLFSSHSTAQTLTLVVNLMCLLLLLASYVMHLIPATCDVDASLRYAFRLMPGYAMGEGLLQLTVLAELPFLETNCGRLPLAVAVTRKYTAFSLEAAGFPILYLAIETAAYFALAIGIDVALSFPLVRARLLPDADAGAASAVADEDDDVRREAARVARGEAAGDTIVVSALRKVYAGGKVAVRSLSFGLPQGECFGFLGINGAGKTTTLKILTGDVVPTSGGARLGGHDILREQEAVRRLIGYCPQFDALLELLTVREHLELYARIKGVPEATLARVVGDKVREMDLGAYEGKLAGSLSGGNKRKLGVAIAMIGAPRLIFLDEPSTGMDPVARRFMWNVISRIATERKQCSIILTTHSMEEAEALCTKIGIMVGGRLRCLGSTQHLKSKFGQGYLAVFKLSAPPRERVARAIEMLRPVLRAPEAAAAAGAAGAPAAPPPPPPLAEWRLSAGAVREACALLGDAARWKMLHPRSTGWALSAQLKSEGSVDAAHFAEWWTGESLGAALHAFVVGAFAGAELAERNGEFFRYKIAGGAPLSSVFGLLEARREELRIQEYSLSQVDLESVFNLLASQQEEERGVARGTVAVTSQAPAAALGARDVGASLNSSSSSSTPPPKVSQRSLFRSLGLSTNAASPAGVALLSVSSSSVEADELR